MFLFAFSQVPQVSLGTVENIELQNYNLVAEVLGWGKT